jgi:hypothetical protein
VQSLSQSTTLASPSTKTGPKNFSSAITAQGMPALVHVLMSFGKSETQNFASWIKKNTVKKYFQLDLDPILYKHVFINRI